MESQSGLPSPTLAAQRHGHERTHQRNDSPTTEKRAPQTHQIDERLVCLLKKGHPHPVRSQGLRSMVVSDPARVRGAALARQQCPISLQASLTSSKANAPLSVHAAWHRGVLQCR
eukprot:1211891-Rhodomonas_salina.5